MNRTAPVAASVEQLVSPITERRDRLIARFDTQFNPAEDATAAILKAKDAAAKRRNLMSLSYATTACLAPSDGNWLRAFSNRPQVQNLPS